MRYLFQVLFIFFAFCVQAQNLDSNAFKILPKYNFKIEKTDTSASITFYVPDSIKVHLVPVDTNIKIDVKTIQTELNAIYYPYGISIEVIEEAKLSDKSWDLNKDGKLNTGEGKTLSRYTDEMSELNTVFKITNANYDEKDIYLYLKKRAGREF